MAGRIDDLENLCGHFLVAMPGMIDPRFSETVIYLCIHNADGAMGLVVNRPLEREGFSMLLKRLSIEAVEPSSGINIFSGGPVEVDRGFILHSLEYIKKTTISVDDKIGLTATIDIIQDIALGSGPKKSLVILGYAGWGAGQLEEEVKRNGWLHVEGDSEILFNIEPEKKWKYAISKIGIDPVMLSSDIGHA